MTSEDFISPEFHRLYLEELEEAIKNGTDRFIEWEEAKRMIDEKTIAKEGIRRGIADLKAGPLLQAKISLRNFSHNIIFPHLSNSGHENS